MIHPGISASIPVIGSPNSSRHPNPASRDTGSDIDLGGSDAKMAVVGWRGRASQPRASAFACSPFEVLLEVVVRQLGQDDQPDDAENDRRSDEQEKCHQESTGQTRHVGVRF